MSKLKLKNHAIQLEYIGVHEYHVRTFVPPTADIEINPSDIKLSVSHDKYDEENKIICVSMEAQIGEDNEECGMPLFLNIVLTGIFRVNEDNFEKKYIKDFAKDNVPYILLPYMREHLYALSVRCGINPITLPLSQVPTSKKTKK